MTVLMVSLLGLPLIIGRRNKRLGELVVFRPRLAQQAKMIHSVRHSGGGRHGNFNLALKVLAGAQHHGILNGIKARARQTFN